LTHITVPLAWLQAFSIKQFLHARNLTMPFTGGAQMPEISDISLGVLPLTPQRWLDLDDLFSPSGHLCGCWCQWFKLTNKRFDEMSDTAKKADLHEQVLRGDLPGLLAYDSERPIGWCAIEPRERYPRLARSPILKPVDDIPVWSLTCFWLQSEYRGMGLTQKLIKAAMRHVEQQGGKMIEAYPIDPRGKISNSQAYHGLYSTLSAWGSRKPRGAPRHGP
jgi:GNAT superfamily N-acetyltransferase